MSNLRVLLCMGTLLGPGCGDLLLEDDPPLRLLLYASPRQLPGDAAHVALVAAEATKGLGAVPTDPLCVRLSAHLGTFTGEGVEPATDGGIACPGSSCAFLALPTGTPRRSFAVYRAPASSNAPDVLLGELYAIGSGDACPPAELPLPTTSGFLTMQVPDVTPPPVPPDLAVTADLTATGDLATAPPDAGAADDGAAAVGADAAANEGGTP